VLRRSFTLSPSRLFSWA